MRIVEGEMLERAELREIYDSVGWTGYTKDLDKIERAFAASHLVLAARDGTGRLRGLARTVSDGETVCYVQDFLVHPDAQRTGIGTLLMTRLQQRYAHCPFFVLSTDPPGSAEAARSHPFYRASGMIPHEEQSMTAFALPVDRPLAPSPAAPSRDGCPVG